MSTKVLHEVTNSETNMRAYVTLGRFGYHVSVQDLDSGNFLPSAKAYPEIQWAKREAEKAVA